MIQAYIKKLRHAADVLEELLSSNPFDQPHVARALARDLDTRQRPGPAAGPLKGHRYNGTHRKQRAQAAALVPAAPVPLAPEPRKPGGVLGKKFKPGTHWTQKPEYRERNLRILAKASRKRRQQAKAAAKGALTKG